MIKTIIEKLCDKEEYYPRLMIALDKKLIVLFSERKTGVVLEVGSSPHKVGHVSSMWAEKSSFVDFKGELTLINGE